MRLDFPTKHTCTNNKSCILKYMETSRRSLKFNFKFLLMYQPKECSSFCLFVCFLVNVDNDQSYQGYLKSSLHFLQRVFPVAASRVFSLSFCTIYFYLYFKLVLFWQSELQRSCDNYQSHHTNFWQLFSHSQADTIVEFLWK